MKGKGVFGWINHGDDTCADEKWLKTGMVKKINTSLVLILKI